MRTSATKGERCDPGRLGGELEAPTSRQRQPRHFTDNSSKSAVTQPLLHHEQHACVVAGFGVNHAVRVKANTRKPGRKKIAGSQAPEDWPAKPGEYARHEERGGRVLLNAWRPADDLVQDAECQSTAREMGVNVLDAERQNPVTHEHASTSLDLSDLGSKRLDDPFSCALLHIPLNATSCDSVRYLFFQGGASQSGCGGSTIRQPKAACRSHLQSRKPVTLRSESQSKIGTVASA